jgi:hypothetical protein
MNNFDGSDNIGGKGGGQSDGVREGLGAEAFKPPTAGEKVEPKSGSDNAAQVTDNVGQVGDAKSLDNSVNQAQKELNKVDAGATEMVNRFDRDPSMSNEQKKDYYDSVKDAAKFFGERDSSPAGAAAADILAKQLDASLKNKK